MLRVVIIVMLAGSLLACNQSGKKEAKREAAQQEYDYRNALQNYKIGLNYMSNNDFPEAVDALEQAIEGDPTNWRYRHALAMSYSLIGRIDDALTQLNKVIEINPDASESYNLKGSILVDQGRYDEATAAFRKVLQDKKYPEPQFAYFNLGKCMAKQGRTMEALAAYQRAAQIKPDFYRAFLAQAEIYREQKDYRKALFYFQKAEPGYSDNVEVLFEIGKSMFMLKDYDRAKAYLAQVTILFPPPNIDKPTQDMLRYIENQQRRGRRR